MIPNATQRSVVRCTDGDNKEITMATRMTMSVEEMRERANAAYDAGAVTAVDLRAMEIYLGKLEQRQNYNRRPEVKARRAAYMKTRNEIAKIGKAKVERLGAILAQLKAQEQARIEAETNADTTETND